MKAFKKWRKKFCGADDRWKTGARQGWRAALEWAKTHEVIYDETDGFAAVFGPGILAIPSDVINQELESN